MRQVRIGEHSFRQCRCGRSATSPQGLVAGQAHCLQQDEAIGARRCNTILINAGVDPSQNSQRVERTLAAAKSPAHESLCAPVLFSAALNRWLAAIRRISYFVARLTELREELVRAMPPLEQIIRGSLSETYKRCGRSNCHCNSGPGHGPKRYLSTVARTGEPPLLGYVPNATYPQVGKFFANYRQLQEMLNEICAINAELLRRRESLD
jgi:hypothetical protein